MPNTSESLSSFASALEELLDELEAAHTGLLSGVAVRRLFRPSIKDHASYPDMLRCIRELEFWNHLKKLLICIHKCSDADKVVQKWGSLLIKIQDVFHEITEELGVVCRNNNNSKVPLEALDDVLHDSEAKIGLFKQETGEALDCLSLLSTCCSLEWSVPLLAFLLQEFLESISGILGSIRRECEHDIEERVLAFRDEVIAPLLRFLAAVLKDVKLRFRGGDQIIHNFFTHIAFVAIRIANQSFHFWINKMVDPVLAKSKIIGLLDLQRETDPLHVQFLEFILNFLRAFVKTNPGQVEHAVCSFLHHILSRKWVMDKDFQKQLEPLIIFIINESEEHQREDAQSLVAEIRSMFILVQRYTLGLLLVDLSPLKLECKLCLLKAEVFLEQQLKSISLGSKVEELAQLLTDFRTFSRQTYQDIEDGKQTFMLCDEMAGQLASLQQSLNWKKITKDRLRIPLLMLLLKIVIFKAKLSFTEFLNATASIMCLEKDQTNSLLEGLNLFAAFVSNHKQDQTENDVEQILTCIKESSRGMTSLFYLFNVNNNIEEMIKNRMHTYSDLLEKMELIKAKLREICPRFPRSNFPKIHGMGFVDFLPDNISELIKHSPDSIALVKHHVERIQLDLEPLRSFLMRLNTENPELKDLGICVTDVVYDAECIVDSIEVGIGDHWQHLLWLHDLLEEIRLVKLQAAKVYEEKSSDVAAHNITQSLSHTISQVSRPEIGELVVCLSEEEEAIIDRLTRGTSQRDVISIVGMPGIGKTTLANKLYNNSRVTFHFHIRAWCSVSQGYSKRELLLDILSSTGALTDEMYQMTDEDLDLKLYQRLKSKRYLIVMDDLWDTGAWNALERSFPNDENGSRILMTSRLRDVLLKAKPDSDPHCLRLLSDDESWELLKMRIFHGECPEELLEVGKVIAKNCKGLPLAVVAITGLLERTEKKQRKWKIIAESLSSRIFDDPQTRCMDILQLSYNHLPDCLKACFLYFGAFLENKDIPVQKLIRLWIAEGFVQKSMMKSLEELAEDYLMDLIGRSLVTVSKRGSRGRVKACRIHDLLRDLCLSKAKEVNFLQLITVSDEPYASFSDLDCGDDFYDYYPSSPVTYQRHRICICLKRKHFVKSSPCGPCTRSLIFFATSDTYLDVPMTYHSFLATSNFSRCWICKTSIWAFPFPLE